MTEKSPIDMLHEVIQGDPLSAMQWNGIVGALKASKGKGNRSYGNNWGEFGDLYIPTPLPPLVAYASEDIPNFSVVSIDSTATARPYMIGYPQTNVKKNVSGMSHFTNGQTYLKEDDPGYFQPMGFTHPYLITYNGADPSVGDIIGPVSNQFYMDSTGTGYEVIQEPDTDNKLAWVVRSNISSGPRFVLVTLDAEMCGSTVSIKTDGVLLPSRQSLDVSSDTIVNPDNRRGQEDDLITLMEYDTTTNPITWKVNSVPLRAITPVTDIEDTANCLRAGGVTIGAEYCGTDTNDFVKIIEYVDCDGVAIGTCVTTDTVGLNDFDVGT